MLLRCVLQRLPTRKTTHLRKLLEQRIHQWKNLQFTNLFEESSCLQARSRLSKHATDDVDWKDRYCRLLKNGRLSAATCILYGSAASGTLRTTQVLDDSTVKEQLQLLHPDAAMVKEDALLRSPIDGMVPPHPSSYLEDLPV
ncbi:hypothetical protein GJ496_011603 [Pomphorhynchus laevis]|nr:hypothetical protein GJ496_011603 [Pomphorhynchus laevis]